MTNHDPIRLQKAIAMAGVCSRRQAEQLIQAGRVCVNGTLIQKLGTRVDPDRDRILVDQQPLTRAQQTATYMLNKPRGLLCSASSSQGATIFSRLALPNKERLFSIGRLDKDSEGLLLLTNDGELANRLTHPRYQHTKTYEVQVAGTVSRTQLATLNRPMQLDDTLTLPARVRIKPAGTAHTILEWSLREGRNRQIRRMCAKVNVPIRVLRRTSIGQLQLGDLPVGSYRKLTPRDMAQLLKPGSPRHQH